MPLYDYKCEKCGEPNPRKLITGFSTSGSNESTENGQVCYVPRRGG